MVGQQRRLNEKWEELVTEGHVPEEGEGRTAEISKRNRERGRRRMPSEDRRVGRKITPTLSPELVQRLRDICRAEGHVGSDGEGVIASPVIENLLRAAVDAYEAGLIRRVEVVETRQELRWGSGSSQRALPDANAMRRYLSDASEQ